MIALIKNVTPFGVDGLRMFYKTNILLFQFDPPYHGLSTDVGELFKKHAISLWWKLKNQLYITHDGVLNEWQAVYSIGVAFPVCWSEMNKND